MSGAPLARANSLLWWMELKSRLAPAAITSRSTLKGRQATPGALQDVRALIGPRPADGHRRDLLIATALAVSGSPAIAGDEISVAEQHVFLDNHLQNIRSATALPYVFTQKGSDKDSFTDRVALNVGAGAADKGEISLDGFRAHSTESGEAGQVLQLPAIAQSPKQEKEVRQVWRDSLNEPRFEEEANRKVLECRQAAQWLAQQPGVARVFYPGLAECDPRGLIGTQMTGPGAMVAFELAGGFELVRQRVDLDLDATPLPPPSEKASR